MLSDFQEKKKHFLALMKIRLEIMLVTSYRKKGFHPAS